MKAFFIAIGSLAIVTTILPFIPTGFWLVRIFDFPRLQIASVAIVALIGYFVFRAKAHWLENVFVGLLVFSITYHAYMIFPYTPLANPQVQLSRGDVKENTISLLFTNVLMDNRDAQKLKEVVRSADPDIILAVETDEWWREQLAEFETTHPHKVLQPQANGYGMLLYSKLELVNEQVKFLIEPEVPSIHTQVRLASGKLIALRCLHPRPPFPTEEDSSAPRDAELLVVGKETKEMKQPVIVYGDLNDVSWSYTNYLFQKVSGLLDPRVGRGLYNTFHADYFFMRFPLDHLFHSVHFRLVEITRLDYVGSDHFPVYIKLSLEPGAEHQQNELPTSETELKEADEKIKEGKTENK